MAPLREGLALTIAYFERLLSGAGSERLDAGALRAWLDTVPSNGARRAAHA